MDSSAGPPDGARGGRTPVHGRGPVAPALALGVLAVVLAVALLTALLLPLLGSALGPAVLGLRVLSLLAGVAAAAAGVLVLRAGRARAAGATGAVLGVVALLLVAVVAPAVSGSQVRAAEARESASPSRPAADDVRIDRCEPEQNAYAAHLSITNSTGSRVRYDVTVEVLDGNGAVRGYLVGADQTGIDPGEVAQQVVRGSVGLGTDGSCRVSSASRAPAPDAG